MRILITGAGGFVGRALMARLEHEGMPVVGTDVSAPDLLPMDVTDRAAVRRVIGETRPDVVVHSAALVDDRLPAPMHRRVNVEGTRVMLEASEGARFVHISSIAALGVNPGLFADATTPMLPESADDGRDYFPAGAYFATKSAAERLVRCLRPDAVVVRPGDVYGPGSKPWVDRPLEMMRAHQPVLVGGGRGLVSLCFIDDLVDGIRLAMDAPGGSLLTFHSGERVTYRAYFTALARAFDAPRPRLSIPSGLARGLARAMERGARWSRPMMTEAAVRYLCRQTQYSLKNAREVGWTPAVGLDEGMRRLRSL